MVYSTALLGKRERLFDNPIYCNDELHSWSWFWQVGKYTCDHILVSVYQYTGIYVGHPRVIITTCYLHHASKSRRSNTHCLPALPINRQKSTPQNHELIARTILFTISLQVMILRHTQSLITLSLSLSCTQPLRVMLPQTLLGKSVGAVLCTRTTKLISITNQMITRSQPQ